MDTQDEPRATPDDVFKPRNIKGFWARLMCVHDFEVRTKGVSRGWPVWIAQCTRCGQPKTFTTEA